MTLGRACVGRAAVALAALLVCVATTAASKPVTFAELLDGHIKARISRAQLPDAEHGMRFDPEAAVYVSNTPTEVLVYGRVVHTLSKGRVKRDAVATCVSGVACMPALQRAVAQARARLGKALRIVPRVLVLVDRTVPYATLLLTLRSIAAAGAHLSIRIVGRNAADELVELPVFVAPERQHTIKSAAPPALITVLMNGDNGIVAASRRYQPDGPARVTGRDSILHEAGLLQLSSGRTAFFLAASSMTPAGSVIDVVARSRQQFRHVVLMAPGDRPVISSEP